MSINKLTKKLGGMLSKLVANKLLLYFILTVFTGTAAVLFICFPENPLTANFLAGSIELIITVTIVDALLNVYEQRDRNSKYTLLNKSTANGMKITLMLAILRIGSLIGYKIEDKEIAMKAQSYSNKQLTSLANKMLKSSELDDLVKKCINSPSKGAALAKKLAKEVGDVLDAEMRSLEKIKPYANPGVQERIADMQIKKTAHLMVVEEMANIFKSVGAEHPKSKQTMIELIWEPIITGEVHGRELSIHNVIKSYIELILYLHAQAEANNLHFEV